MRVNYMKNNDKVVTKCMVCNDMIEIDNSELNSYYQKLILCDRCRQSLLFIKDNYEIINKIVKSYEKPSISDEKIEIEDSIAASGNDIYNVREIFK